ncbi:opsin-3-like [Pelobates fuscus]|uniref:opsin-3-like n=1 Tax=Pelobates fuscus TaxID=191477 RepID=UPI002FE43E7F
MSQINISDLKQQPWEQNKDLFTQDTYELLALTVTIFGILGFCNNLLVLILYCKFQRLRTPSNLLLANISLSDLFFSVFGASFTFVSCMRRWWAWESTACIFEGFIKSLFGLVSVFTFTVLAYERYGRVIHDKVIDFPWGWRAITWVWIYSALWASAPLIGWNRYTYEIHGLDCSLNWIPSGPKEISFVLVFFIACLAVPMGIMLFCYGQILYAIRKLRSVPNLHTSQAVKILDYEIYVAKMSCLVILAFLCYWMPYAVMSLLATCGIGLVTPTNAMIPSFLAKSIAVSNPVIYLFMSKKFREGVQVLCCHCWGFQRTFHGKPFYRHRRRIQPICVPHNGGNRGKRRISFSSSSIICHVSTKQTETHHTSKDSKGFVTKERLLGKVTFSS